jgi:hypothetical protein
MYKRKEGMRNENISSFNLSLTIFSCNSLHAEEMVPDRPTDSGRCPVQTIVSFVSAADNANMCATTDVGETLVLDACLNLELHLPQLFLRTLD